MNSTSSRIARRIIDCEVGITAAVALTVLLFNWVSPAVADQPTFLKTHCFECHSGDTKSGGLDLSSLPSDLTQPQLFAKWERIHDRVANGEMPPKSGTLPKPADRAEFVQSLSRQLTTVHEASKGTVLRRLNRREYQHTLNDLFGTNLKLAERLPEDGRSHEFDNIGESLGISLVQMQRYLEGANAVLDESIQRTLDRPERKVVKASYATTQGAEQWLGKIWLKRDDGAVVFFKNYGYPTGMLREANVQKDGWYKVRVTGYAYQSDQPITFALGATTFARGLEQPTFGYFELPPGPPTTIETTTWIPALADVGGEKGNKGKKVSVPDTFFFSRGFAEWTATNETYCVAGVTVTGIRKNNRTGSMAWSSCRESMKKSLSS